jgi:hypothetical protein
MFAPPAITFNVTCYKQVEFVAEKTTALALGALAVMTVMPVPRAEAG